MIRSTLTAASAIFLCAFAPLSAHADQAQNIQQTLDRPGAPVYGKGDAKVNVVEFFDPACETCRDFAPYVKKIVDDSNGKVKLTLRYLPLHQGSDKVSQALEAARLQGKYWQALDAIFSMQPVWAAHHKPQPEMVWKIMERAGVDIPKAQKDAESFAIVSVVKRDAADAATLRITKTPGYFVNGKPLVRFGDEELKALIQSEVNAVYGK